MGILTNALLKSLQLLLESIVDHHEKQHLIRGMVLA